MTARFFKYTLRTTDVDGAQRFYAALFGERARAFDLVPLPEQALARGAKPHWLGFIAVADVDATAAGFVERGAQRLPSASDSAVLRDAGGALVGLSRPGGAGAAFAPSWHVLLTADVERAKASYAALLGWSFYPPVNLGELGVVHPFAWREGEPPAGVFGAVEDRPGAHASWAFNVTVANLDEAVAAVRSGGGLVLGPSTLPNGERVAVCDDAQGAMFGLRTPA